MTTTPLTAPLRREAKSSLEPAVRRIHRTAATLLGVFAALHLGNHLLAVAGPETHQLGLVALRTVYRSPFAEPVLLLAVASQVLTGSMLFWKTRHRKDSSRWQRWSGLGLGFFLTVHTTAALVTRAVLDLDTNFYWAASVLRWPLVMFFAPYYTLGVICCIVHLGMALQGSAKWRWLVLGCVVAALILASFGGLHL